MRAAPMHPYLVLLPVGFASADGCPPHGALLPHLFTLATHRKRPFGGSFSVALSVGSRRPGVTWHRALWSPDFPRRDFRAATVWPTPRAHCTQVGRALPAIALSSRTSRRAAPAGCPWSGTPDSATPVPLDGFGRSLRGRIAPRRRSFRSCAGAGHRPRRDRRCPSEQSSDNATSQSRRVRDAPYRGIENGVIFSPVDASRMASLPRCSTSSIFTTACIGRCSTRV